MECAFENNGTNGILNIGELDAIRINFMVAGIGGIGKSTFLNVFFKMYKAEGVEIKERNGNRSNRTLKIESAGDFLLKSSSNVNVHFHLIDTPGFGDSINNEHAINEVKDYLENAHNSWSSLDIREMTNMEINAADTRIHGIFYFVSPHRMKKIDTEFIVQLGQLAPIVLVVAKADSMTWLERKEYLLEIQSSLNTLSVSAERTEFPIVFDFEESDELEFLCPEQQQQHGEAQGAAQDKLDETQPQKPVASQFPGIDLPECSFGGQMKTTSAVAPLLTPPGQHEDCSSEFACLSDLGQSQIDELKFRVDTGSANYSSDASYSVDECFADEGDEEELSAESVNSPDSLRRDPVAHSVEPRTFANVPTDTLAECTHRQSANEGAEESRSLPRIRNVFAVVCDRSSSGMRQYQWGSLQIFNKDHSDFRRLQELVFERGAHIMKMRALTERMTIAQYKRQCSLQGRLGLAAKAARKHGEAVSGVVERALWVALVVLLLVFVASRGDLEKTRQSLRWALDSVLPFLAR